MAEPEGGQDRPFDRTPPPDLNQGRPRRVHPPAAEQGEVVPGQCPGGEGGEDAREREQGQPHTGKTPTPSKSSNSRTGCGATRRKRLKKKAEWPNANTSRPRCGSQSQRNAPGNSHGGTGRSVMPSRFMTPPYHAGQDLPSSRSTAQQPRT